MFNFLFKNPTANFSQTQTKVYEVALEWSLKYQAFFQRSQSKEQAVKVKLLAVHNAIVAYFQTTQEPQACEQVYKALLKKLSIPKNDQYLESLKDHQLALESEKKNVGAGHFGIALLVQEILGDDVQNSGEQAQKLGEAVAMVLSDWASLHKELSGKEMQTYRGGFKPRR